MALRARTFEHDELTTTALRGSLSSHASVAVEAPQLSVVIVNFCQWKNTALLTRLLRQSEAIRSGAAEIVIVDNHSPPAKPSRILSRLSGVTVHENDSNEGFARAVNRGSRISRGEWMLLLNPDCTVPIGFLDEVLKSAQRWPDHDDRAAIVGFGLRNPDGSAQAGVGRYPTLLRTLAGLCSPRSLRKCRVISGTSRQAVPWVTGGCLLVRRDCYDDLGGLDERFFLYYEDVDFCRRAQERGWSVWYDPGLQVTHHWPLHVRQVPPALRLVTRHALLTYSRKHWDRIPSALLHGIVWLEAQVRELASRCRGDAEAAECFRELRRLVADLHRGRAESVADRIQHAAALLYETAAVQDGRTS